MTAGACKMEEPILSGLDAALHELGMLSSVTDSRREYLKEQQLQRQYNANRQALNVLHMNTRFAIDCDIGRNKKLSRRYKPYTPYFTREERTRTKSENSDVDVEWFCGTSLMPVITNSSDNCGLYKSRSLENVKVTVSEEVDNQAPEVESVSNQIKQLHVCE